MPAKNASLLSVIAPAFQEGPYIHGALTELVRALEALNRPYEIVLVSDGNTDDTVGEAGRVDCEHLRVLHYEPRRGKGYALRHGFFDSRGDIVVFIDADMELHPDGIGTLLKIMQEQRADAVVGSKRDPRSEVFYPGWRRIQSAAYQRLIRLLFHLDLSDTQTGLKVFRRNVLDRVIPHLESEGFAFDLELLVLANDAGFRIVEGPVQLDFKFQSTTGVRAVLHVLGDTLRIARRRRHAGQLLDLTAGVARGPATAAPTDEALSAR